MTISIRVRLTKKGRKNLGNLCAALAIASLILAFLAARTHDWLPLFLAVVGLALTARATFKLMIPRKTTTRYSTRTRKTTRRETW